MHQNCSVPEIQETERSDTLQVSEKIKAFYNYKLILPKLTVVSSFSSSGLLPANDFLCVRQFCSFSIISQFIMGLNPILSQINAVYTIPSYFSDANFNIIHSPTSWSPQ
jgi:hypothetical protein